MNGLLVLGVFTLAALWPPWPFGRDRGEAPETIEALESRAVAVDTVARVADSDAKAIENYRLFLELAAEDPLLEAEAMRRLADLQLAEREAADVQRSLEDMRVELAPTIGLYEELLESYPDYERNDQVLYQLARAYEAGGRSEHALSALDRLVAEYPDAPYRAEAEFRRGETLFVEQRYGEAEQAYRNVLAVGAETAFTEQASYKLGWSLFKQARYEESLAPFFAVLDAQFGADSDPAAVYAALGRARQELLDDALRVLAISFSYLDGPHSVSSWFAARGAPGYAYVLYTTLGDLYLEQERYQDAADAYGAFLELDAYHARAPLLQGQVVDAYEQGGFADLVLDAKRGFVEQYGPDSPYWTRFTYESQPDVIAELKTHVGDLAAYHHAEAQAGGGAEDYAAAARWYRSSLRAFPGDADAPATHFLLSEVLFESGDHAAAAAEYESTAYAYAYHARSSEAGYAALLAYAEHERTLSGSARAQWHRRAITSALRFSQTYPEHAQSAAVEADAAEKLFALDEFEAARDVAARVVAREPRVEAELRRTAWTVIAHSQFDLEDFAAAEAAYLRLEGMLEAGEPRDAVSERLASSIYKQGEQARDAGATAEAVEHFLRVGRAAPDSPVRATAEYDAAAALVNLGQWARAADVLERFRASFPDHALAEDVSASLAVAYVETGDSARAAAEFERIAAGGGAADVRREALWRAADLYAEADRPGDAARALDDFVQRYPRPVGESIEALERLAQMAGARGDGTARMRRLEQIVAADAGAGAERSGRTRYLAAKAQLALAEPAREAYRAVRLTVPLEASLRRKRARMETALAAYGKAADYGLAEITTAATYEIAELYHELSRALFDSERPAELSPIELAQYDILLEEQAFPFEEEAIELHELNAARTAEGVYDEWVVKSLGVLAQLVPARYAKDEMGERFVGTFY